MKILCFSVGISSWLVFNIMVMCIMSHHYSFSLSIDSGTRVNRWITTACQCPSSMTFHSSQATVVALSTNKILSFKFTDKPYSKLSGNFNPIHIDHHFSDLAPLRVSLLLALSPSSCGQVSFAHSLRNHMVTAGLVWCMRTTKVSSCYTVFRSFCSFISLFIGRVLTVEEQNLLSVAYKNIIGAQHACCLINWAEGLGRERGSSFYDQVKGYRQEKVEITTG